MRTIMAMLIFYLCFVTQTTIFSPAMLQLKSETPNFDTRTSGTRQVFYAIRKGGKAPVQTNTKQTPIKEPQNTSPINPTTANETNPSQNLNAVSNDKILSEAKISVSTISTETASQTAKTSQQNIKKQQAAPIKIVVQIKKNQPKPPDNKNTNQNKNGQESQKTNKIISFTSYAQPEIPKPTVNPQPTYIEILTEPRIRVDPGLSQADLRLVMNDHAPVLQVYADEPIPEARIRVQDKFFIFWR